MSLNNDDAPRDASLGMSDSVMADITPNKTSIIDDAVDIFEKMIAKPDDEIVDLKVFHWDITDFKELCMSLGDGKKKYSPKFTAGELEWSILLFPHGNLSAQSNPQEEYLSAYLALNINDKKAYCCAQFMLSVSEYEDPTNHIDHSAFHRFTLDNIDWGFTRLLELKKLKNDFLKNNSLRLTAVVRVINDSTGVLWHPLDDSYNSKEFTGHVGLTNQGATCYMNSLFQSLYCTNLFRKAVYQIPTENDDPNESVALALQRVFYNLQFSSEPVGTVEMTKSFGWDSAEAFNQHDVQEFNRVIQDNLENKMKNTPADGKIKELFLGRMKSYIKCINVNCESARFEDYYDIQLNVKGCKTLEESFKDYIAEEILEGDNKYSAEGHGLQDAKKGVIFESFPPVLHLQLKRYEYDMMKDTMVKINDRHEFPLTIDLEPYLSDNADKSSPHIYALHGVLVHQGYLDGGHYFAFVKPTKDSRWLKFDDACVTPSKLKEVMEENFGGGDMRNVKRATSAYMLVYIRESLLDNILGEVTDDDIPTHLSQRIDLERLEQERRIEQERLEQERRIEQDRLEQERRAKERREDLLYMKVTIANDELFKANEGFDFVTFDANQIQRFSKDLSFRELKDNISKEYNVPLNGFRLWALVNRLNGTIRLDTPILAEDDNITLSEIQEKYTPAVRPQQLLRLYIEKARAVSGNFEPFPAVPTKKSDHVLIFIKQFDPNLQKIRGIGKIYVSKAGKVKDIEQDVKKMASIPSEEPILLFEEIKPDMMEEKDPEMTFIKAEIQDGDILCVQPTPTKEQVAAFRAQGKHATFPEFMDFLFHKTTVLFSSKSNDPIDNFSLDLHRNLKYDSVAAHVAAKLGVEAKKIRFFVLGVNDEPKPIPRSFQQSSGDLSLKEMIKYTKDPKEPQLFYEQLDINLEDLESQHRVKMIVCIPSQKDETVVEVLVPKQSQIVDLITAMEAKGTKLDPAQIRVYDTIDHRFNHEFQMNDSVQSISERPAQLYVEEIPDDELNMSEQDSCIPVVHYFRDVRNKHSVPFKFVVKKDEEFVDTKKRLQERTGLSEKDISKVKFSIVTQYSAVPIEEDNFKLSDHLFSENESLGMDHADKSGKSNRSSGGRGLVIRR